MEKHYKDFSNTEQVPEPPKNHEPCPRDDDDENVTLSQLGQRKVKKNKVKAEDEEALCRAYVKTLEPIIKLMEPGLDNKKVPYKCSICISPKYPRGKIGERAAMRINSVKHFITKHISGPTHQKNLRLQDNVENEIVVEKVKCQGICLNDPHTARNLNIIKNEFILWVKLANHQEFSRNTYTYDSSLDAWILRSSDCQEELPAFEVQQGSLPACQKCFDMVKRRSIYKNCLKFHAKYVAAHLLMVRVFQGEDEAQALISRIKEGAHYRSKPSMLNELFQLDTLSLQQWVRASFMCDGRGSEEMKRFVATTVEPALQVNVDSVPARLSEVTANFTAILKGKDCSDQEALDIKLATAAISGKLSSNPVLQGLCLCFRRQLDKEARNVTNLRGRVSAEVSELERDLMADAGLQLALASGNKVLAREFGVTGSSMRINFEKLKEKSLPVPALALCFAGQLEENFWLAEQRFPRPHMAPQRALVKDNE